MTKRLIYVSGCDDATAVEMDLTDDEFAVVQRVAAAVTAKGGGCMPTIETDSEGGSHYGWRYANEDED